MALPKSMRLKGHRTFDYIHKNSVKYYGKLMTFKIARSNKQILISHRHEYLLKNIQGERNHKPYWLLVNLKIGDFYNDKSKLLEEFQYLMFKSGLIK